MAIVAGIDEAGLGPILGPLVVTGAAFRVPDEHADGCLWDTLRETCTKKTTKSGHRLPITDSKKLYKSRSGLGGLERAVLAMLASKGQTPGTLSELLGIVAPRTVASLVEYPWYKDRDLALPREVDADAIGLQAKAIRKNCDEQNVEFLQALSEPLLEGEYNRVVRRTENKSTVLTGQAMRIVHRIVTGAGNEPVRLYIDRLGGRTHYREQLMLTLAGWEMNVIEESQERSLYELKHGESCVRIEFATKGDLHRFPVALASIFSKYIRELFMEVFNDYWSSQVEELAPTAGYYVDAQRWLEEAATAIEKTGTSRDMLVRER